MNEELLRMRAISTRLMDETPVAFHRALYPKIDWENRLICFKGARGTGKTFFVNQVAAAGHSLVCAEQGDFLVDGRFLFEVGGRRKRFTQIKDMPDSYVVADDLEVGTGNRIPLWLFVFLY
jgi:hypothetical protein